MTNNVETGQHERPIVRLNPPTLFDAIANGHSQISVVEPGRLAFLSGQVAWKPGSGPAPASLAEQAELVARNIASALDAVGAGPKDIVMVRLYIVNMTRDRLFEAWRPITAFLDGTLPSVSALGISALAGPDLQLEVEVVARLTS